MQISPRYGDDPILRVETNLGDVGVPMLRQRRRVGDILAGLTVEQWAAPTRCDAWRVQDVVAHLVSTNQFWAASIRAGLAGTPTQLLAEFDPVATPAQMAETVRTWSTIEALDHFFETNDHLADAVGAIQGDAWSTTLAEAPPGHIAVRAVVLHALWDAWVHERDIVLPLGLPAIEEPDEVAASLHYAAALGPAFAVSTGSARRGVLRVTVTDPDIDIVIEIGANVVVRDRAAADAADAVTLRGSAVDVLEGLSFRVPLPAVPDEGQWMMSGLAEVFEVAPA